MKRRRGPKFEGAVYVGQGEHNYAKKLMRLIQQNRDLFLREGRQRHMHINHTHAPKLWHRVRPGDLEARVTHDGHCALVVNGNHFCDCDPEIVFLEKDEK